MKTVLSIAGSDPSGGAGIQADIKTISANGGYAMCAITALTAQNTREVKDILGVPPRFLESQLISVFEDIFPDSIKIGMVSGKESIKVIKNTLVKYKAKNIVVDPVMVATSGYSLVKTEEIKAMTEELLPIADLITPNLKEAQVLAEREITDKKDMENAAKELFNMYGCGVLIKGGHKKGDCDDYLYNKGKGRWYMQKRINNQNTHGTGCTLSSGIATYLAKGIETEKSVEYAKKYITGAIRDGLNLGHGRGPLNHMFELKGLGKL